MAGSNYPPGTGPNDPNAPWNEPDPPECPDCGNLIGNVDQHAEDCPSGHMDQEALAEYYDQAARKDYDDIQEERRFQGDADG